MCSCLARQDAVDLRQRRCVLKPRVGVYPRLPWVIACPTSQQPQRKQDAGIAGRAPGTAFERTHELVQFGDIAAFDECPDDADLMLVVDEAVPIAGRGPAL